MLSRVADSIYWMARYIERAENLARFMDVTLNLILDQPEGADQQWAPLVYTTGDQEWFDEHYPAPTSENVIQFLTFDRRYPNSIVSVVSYARENARTIRETISSETWEQINEFYHFVNEAIGSFRSAEEGFEFFQMVKQHSHLFNGILDSTMSHGKGWHFANLGRLLERADKTSRILDVKYFTLLPSLQDVGTTIDALQWSAVLRSVSGFEMYRKRYHQITVHRIIEFLILDNAFPRAVKYCIGRADESLHELSGTRPGTYCNTCEQRLGQLNGELTYVDVDAIVNQGLHEFVDALQVRLNQIGEAIHDTFVAVSTPEMSQSQTQ